MKLGDAIKADEPFSEFVKLAESIDSNSAPIELRMKFLSETENQEQLNKLKPIDVPPVAKGGRFTEAHAFNLMLSLKKWGFEEQEKAEKWVAWYNQITSEPVKPPPLEYVDLTKIPVELRLKHLIQNPELLFKSPEPALPEKRDVAIARVPGPGEPGHIQGGSTGVELSPADDHEWRKQVAEELFNKPQAQRFNQGKTKLAFLTSAPHACKGISDVMEMGAYKYGLHNWKKGLKHIEVIESLLRHLLAWQSGEDTDEESGLLHVDHIATNALFLAELTRIQPTFDDRSKGVE